MAKQSTPDYQEGSFDTDRLLKYVYPGQRNSIRRTREDNLKELTDELNSKLTVVEAEVLKLKEEISRSSKSLDSRMERFQDSIDQKTQRFEDKADKDKFRAVEVIGVFVALFTFVSSEIQIFKIVESVEEGFALSLVAAGLLNNFVILLLIMVKPRNDELIGQNVDSRFWVMLVFSSILVIAGILLISKG